MPVKNNLNKPAFGFVKRVDNGSTVLTYEIWENFLPNKVIAGETRPYFPDILSTEQLETFIPFWMELGVELNDPILSLQLDKNGGSTILYRYSDEREGTPPNACSRIIKPIFEKGIEKIILSDYSKSTFILHTSLKSSTLKNDIKDFMLIIEKAVSSDDVLREKDMQNDMFANTYILDRRINKVE